MKVLVLSDSHSSVRFMRDCMNAVKPDAVVHLGDYFQDGRVIADENRPLPFYQVPGNCDGFYGPHAPKDTLVCQIDGVSLLLTHGHKFRVKDGVSSLLAYARECGVQAVLFGHTHNALCLQEEDGLWILNPGAAGFWNSSAGIVEIGQGKITACRIIRQTDLDAMV